MVATQEAIVHKNRNTTRRKPLLPHKLIDRLGLPGEVRIPATFEDWIELSLDCEYRVEYVKGHVVSIFDTNTKTNQTMGQATLTHEQIVANIIIALGRLFDDNANVLILGSNMPTFIAEGKAVVNPDVCIVTEQPIIIPYRHKKRTQNCLTNPCVVVEVLSQGTRNYDLVDKKNNYFINPSIQQVIFVEQYWAEISSYTRENDGKWLYALNNEPTDTHLVLGEKLELSRVYKKIVF
jgi:Uma2 family endonuclease